VEYRQATSDDAPLLARLNKELIIDEGHRNPMSVAELERRMAGWLAQQYAAVLFVRDGRPVGYALYGPEADYVYLRQFFVCRDCQRTGVGRAAMQWLRHNVWSGSRIRVEVLAGNRAGVAFWRAVGFCDYSLTMETAGDGAG
jgi:predicted acetyltransferase